MANARAVDGGEQVDQDKAKLSTTTDGKPPRPGFENASAPAPVDPETGQHEAYWVLSEEENQRVCAPGADIIHPSQMRIRNDHGECTCRDLRS